MKKLILNTLLAFFVTFFLTFISANVVNAQDQISQNGEELVLLIWSDYLDPDLIKEFERKYKVNVKQVYYESDELKDEMLLASDGKGYDIVLGSGISIIPYLKRNWITPLNSQNIPNLKHIDQRWLNAHPEISGHAVPYLWGTLGIAYRKDLLKQDIISWMQIFRPVERLRKKIIMINDSRDVIGAALRALGNSLNSSNPQHYDEVEKLLLSQKPYVSVYSYFALNEESVLVTGKAWMGMVYNGDALVLQELHPGITYIVPEEGTSLWVDYLVVMRASQHQKIATEFINFLNEPENAARIASYLMYATPNKSAEKYLSKDHIENPAIYPKREILEKSELSKKLPPRIIKRRNAIFSNLVN